MQRHNQVVGAAMWPGSLQAAGELDVSDSSGRQVHIPVVDLVVNRGLVNVILERVDEVLSVWGELFARKLVSWN